MQRVQTRRAESRIIDERIVDAAIACVDEQGVDGVGVADVPRAVGLTKGAFYARYQDLPELLADLWTRHGARIVDELALEAAGIATTWPTLDHGRLAGLCRSTPERRVAFELLVVASRINELGDIVPAAVGTSLRVAGLMDPDGSGSNTAGLGLLALGLGSIAHGRVGGSVEHDAAAIAGWLGVGGRRAWTASPLSPTPRLDIRFAPIDPDVVLTDRELRRLRLLDAAVAVVARSGVRHATFRRISRASGYPHTAVYQEYGGLQELLLDLVRTFTAATLRGMTDRRPYTDPDLEGALMAGGMAPGGRTIRRLTLEFLLARHDPVMAEVAARADGAIYTAIATLLAGPDGPGHDVIVRYRHAHRALATGLAAIEESVGGMAGIDWRPVLGALQVGALAAAGVPDTA